MKKITYAILCFVIYITLILSGCMFSNGKKDTTKNIDTPNIDKAGSESRVLFHFNNWYDGEPKESGDSEIIEQLQKNLRDNGINIKIIPYYDYSIAIGRHSYTEVIKEMSASGAIDAFHVPKNLKIDESDINMFEELATINQGDILQNTAPVLYSKLQKLEAMKDTDRMSYIPANVIGRTESGRSAVVIRKDVVRKLGIDSIRNISEYESILKRIKTETQYIPGYIQVMKCNDVMLQELGYYSIENITGDFGGMLFAFRNDDNEFNKPIPIEQIPGINTQFMRLFDLHQQGLLKLTGTGAYPDFSNVASFIVPAGTVIPTFDYDNSRAFLLYPDQPVKKEMSISSDRIYILKNSKVQNEIIRMLEWINSKTENMRLIRYGRQGEDYAADNNAVKVLLSGKQPGNYDEVTRTYDYRFRFQFLLSSVDDDGLLKSGNSSIPDSMKKEVAKAQNTFLPLEKLILENPAKNINNIMNEVAGEYEANDIDISKLTGLSSRRVYDYYRVFEFYLPQGLNVFGNFVKGQSLDEVKIIQAFYSEVIRRIGK